MRTDVRKAKNKYIWTNNIGCIINVIWCLIFRKNHLVKSLSTAWQMEYQIFIRSLEASFSAFNFLSPWSNISYIYDHLEENKYPK